MERKNTQDKVWARGELNNQRKDADRKGLVNKEPKEWDLKGGKSTRGRKIT